MCRTHTSTMPTQGQGHNEGYEFKPVTVCPLHISFNRRRIFVKFWSNVRLTCADFISTCWLKVKVTIDLVPLKIFLLNSNEMFTSVRLWKNNFVSTSRKHTYIILTLLKPHFYIVKLEFTGVYIIFLISAVFSIFLFSYFGEAVLTSTHNLCFEQKYEKYHIFLSENFSFFGGKKISVHLNRRVFVMSGIRTQDLVIQSQEC